MLSKTIPTDSPCYNDLEKSIVSPIYDDRLVVIGEKVKGQNFGSTGIKLANMLQCYHTPSSFHDQGPEPLNPPGEGLM